MLFESVGDLRGVRKRSLALAASLGVHALALLLVAFIGTREAVQEIYRNAVPVLFYGATPAPPPPPPPPPAAASVAPRTPRVRPKPQTIVVPQITPEQPKAAEPEPQAEPERPTEAAPPASDGVVGGVAGGVAGGVVGGTLGGVSGGSVGGVVGGGGAGSDDAPVRLKRDMTPARIRSRVEPLYPKLARDARQEGRVMLMLTVDRSGRVRDVRVISGPSLLAAAAVDAVAQWTYEPARAPDGRAIAVYMVQPVEFRLR